jgi:nanoRNase/pAp phosphatase (c-di-AMP/oligoRNAs hydrolase)
VKGIEGWTPLCIIDHHRRAGKDINAEFEIIDEDSPSASEIVASLILSLPYKTNSPLTNSAAFALAVGIIADTAQFNSGRLQTFELLAKLMKMTGATYRELLFYADPPKSLDKKIAIAKALKKMDYVEYKGYLIVTCKSGSSEGDTATVLASKLDAAFVAKKDTKNRGYTRVSARANKNADLKLNEVMMKVGERLNGKGGGHFKAAGARVQAKQDEALTTCVEVLKQWIDANSKK